VCDNARHPDIIGELATADGSADGSAVQTAEQMHAASRMNREVHLHVSNWAAHKPATFIKVDITANHGGYTALAEIDFLTA
jgi:hypothetical protein